MRYQSGAVCRKPPEQIDKRRDGPTVSRSIPAADTRYRAIYSGTIPPPRSSDGSTAPQTAETAAHRPRQASTAGTDRRSLTAPAGFFRARYGAGDDLRTGAARTPPELSRSARSAISNFFIARCDLVQLSELISANCTK